MQEEVGRALQQARMRHHQPRLQLLGPTIGCQLAITALRLHTLDATRPGERERRVLLRHSYNRVEARRSCAEDRNVVALHLHQIPLSRFDEAEPLDGHEVLLAVAVTLRTPLLEDVLYSQWVQAILDAQRQKQPHVDVAQVHPSNRKGIPGVRRHRPAAEKEAAHRLDVGNVGQMRSARREVQDDEQPAGGRMERARGVLRKELGQQEARHDQLEFGELEAFFAVGRRELEDALQVVLVWARQANSAEFGGELHGRHLSVVVRLAHRIENLHHSVRGQIEKALEQVLAHIAEIPSLQSAAEARQQWRVDGNAAPEIRLLGPIERRERRPWRSSSLRREDRVRRHSSAGRGDRRAYAKAGPTQHPAPLDHAQAQDAKIVLVKTGEVVRRADVLPDEAAENSDVTIRHQRAQDALRGLSVNGVRAVERDRLYIRPAPRASPCPSRLLPQPASGALACFSRPPLQPAPRAVIRCSSLIKAHAGAGSGRYSATLGVRHSIAEGVP
mmetsp:Transcript_40336/g.111094  ORF Transcript_40336/g.111094 Transcript_40336/m.111094 type:complete len:501 (-) Transcript_40336:19-1521(-)